MSEPEYVIDVRGLTKRFGHRTVVRDMDLKVAKGEIYGFLGPNGSGKTTSIRMICGLLRPDAGSGTCLGYDVLNQAHLIKPHVGYMTQKFSLYEDLTVRENLRFMASLYSLEKSRQVVENSIERMGLGPYAKLLAGNLSGGWKQRLALAACILHEPSLLLLDEPTAGVDPSARRDFWDEVHQLASEGITALISTHYMDEAERCKRLAYIAYGNLLTSGTADEIIAERNLATWSASGGDMHDLSEHLSHAPGVEQVAAFGNTLHVSGRDRAALEESIAPYRRDYAWKEIETSLEEVFIHLMRESRFNGGPHD